MAANTRSVYLRNREEVGGKSHFAVDVEARLEILRVRSHICFLGFHCVEVD